MSRPFASLPLDLVERGVQGLDEVLQGWHDRACDTVREGSCWCCCISCTEHDVTERLREYYWDMVHEQAIRKGATVCASDLPAHETDAPPSSTGG